jgi:HSP20 family protein
MIVIRRGLSRDRVRRSFENDEVFRALMYSGSSVRPTSRGVWRPPIEVYETGEALEVVAEIAGLDIERIDIVVEGDVLSISGVRPDPAACDGRSYHEARISYGHFAVDVQLSPNLDIGNARANYESGFLKISLPKTAPRTIVPRTITESDSRGNE